MVLGSECASALGIGSSHKGRDGGEFLMHGDDEGEELVTGVVKQKKYCYLMAG